MFSIFTNVMSRVTHSEAGLPVVFFRLVTFSYHPIYFIFSTAAFRILEIAISNAGEGKLNIKTHRRVVHARLIDK